MAKDMYNPYQALIEQLDQKISETEKLVADPEMGQLAVIELEQLHTQKQEFETAAAEMEQPELTPDFVIKTNCTIEIRQGTGGDEAKLWAEDLLRMYARFCEIVGFKLQYIDDMVIKISGKISLSSDQETTSNDQPKSAYEVFQFESGVHRVQRVPTTEAQGRIHTSTATVAVLPEVPKTAVQIRDEDLEWQFMRAGGAGGQSVNKTNSAVRLIHHPSGVAISARTERSQAQNREIALELLRSQLWEIEEEKRLTALGEARAAIGQARRAEKIRTYNYPQNRVTDHRTKQSWYNLSTIMEGNISDMLSEIYRVLSNPNQLAELAGTDDDDLTT